MNRDLWNVNMVEKAIVQKSKSSAIIVVQDASFVDLSRCISLQLLVVVRDHHIGIDVFATVYIYCQYKITDPCNFGVRSSQ